jgi:hypothetical protein
MEILWMVFYHLKKIFHVLNAMETFLKIRFETFSNM